VIAVATSSIRLSGPLASEPGANSFFRVTHRAVCRWCVRQQLTRTERTNMKTKKLMKAIVAIGLTVGTPVTAVAPASANSNVSPRGDVREVSITRVSLNAAGQTAFSFRVVLEKNTDAFLVFQVGPSARDVVVRQRVRCNQTVARWKDTCFVDFNAAMPAGSRKAAFAAIPSTPGDGSIAVGLADPFQWEVVRNAIGRNGPYTAVTSQFFSCEQKYGPFSGWTASTSDRKEFERVYRVKTWMSVFGLFLNDAGTILSFIPTDRLKTGDVAEIIAENVASYIWNQALKMPSVTVGEALRFGSIMAGYPFGPYLATYGC
ncbi:MAG: hypothetical protein ACKOD2_00350, partial [Ilumatobacteraceae bacterium]